MAKDNKNMPRNADTATPKVRKVVNLDGPPPPVFYANNVNVEVSSFDVRFRLGQVKGATEHEVHVHDVAFVYMSHEHFKAFMTAASEGMAQVDHIRRLKVGEGTNG